MMDEFRTKKQQKGLNIRLRTVSKELGTGGERKVKKTKISPQAQSVPGTIGQFRNSAQFSSKRLEKEEGDADASC